MKLFIKTFGCQMNAHDSEKFLGILKEIGFEVKENRNYFGTLCGYRISWTI